jgi:hypothetical protein
VYIWAKYSLEESQDPEKRKLFKEKFYEYLKIAKESPERLQIWFWDESGFSLRVLRRKNWSKKGKRKKVKGNRRKGRVNVMGALRFSDKKTRVEFLEKGTGLSPCLCVMLCYELKQANNLSRRCSKLANP